MKTLATVLLSLILAYSIQASGMLREGSVDLGGSASFHYTTGELYEGYDESSQTHYSLQPDIGYFVIDGLSIGAVVNYSRDDYSYAEVTAVGGGPRVAYYFLPEKPSSPFFTAAYLFFEEKYYYNDSYGIRHAETELTLSAGYLIGINSHVALTTAVGYSSERLKYTGHHQSYDDSSIDAERNGNRWSVLVGFKIFQFE